MPRSNNHPYYPKSKKYARVPYARPDKIKETQVSSEAEEVSSTSSDENENPENEKETTDALHIDFKNLLVCFVSETRHNYPSTWTEIYDTIRKFEKAHRCPQFAHHFIETFKEKYYWPSMITKQEIKNLDISKESINERIRYNQLESTIKGTSIDKLCHISISPVNEIKSKYQSLNQKHQDHLEFLLVLKLADYRENLADKLKENLNSKTNSKNNTETYHQVKTKSKKTKDDIEELVLQFDTKKDAAKFLSEYSNFRQFNNVEVQDTDVKVLFDINDVDSIFQFWERFVKDRNHTILGTERMDDLLNNFE